MKSRSLDSHRWNIFCRILSGILLLCSTLLAQRPPVRVPPNPVPQTGTQQNQKPAMLKIRIEEGRITAEITNCYMQNVLRELAERTGIIFEVQSQENPLVSLRLQKISLPETIMRITSGSNTMFFYGKGTQVQERITLVRVFPRGNPSLQPSVVYLGTGVVTKSNVDIETPEQALKVLAENTNVENREKAISFLATTKSEAGIQALELSISDPAPEIRVASIESLATLGVRTALPDIIKSLKDVHPGVRQSATMAVALLGDARNLKDINPLRADRDPGVAAAAETAIRKLSTAAKK